MSHVVSLELRVKDLGSLGVAAMQCGMEVVQKSNYAWWGTSVGDFAIPEGFTAADLGKCDYALRVVGNGEAYEVGVVKSRKHPGEYELLFDFYGDKGQMLLDAIGEGGCKLKQEYSAATTTRWARKQGYRVHRTMTADGKIVLKARR